MLCVFVVVLIRKIGFVGLLHPRLRHFARTVDRILDLAALRHAPPPSFRLLRINRLVPNSFLLGYLPPPANMAHYDERGGSGRSLGYLVLFVCGAWFLVRRRDL